MDSNQSNVVRMPAFEEIVQSAGQETLKASLDTLFDGDLEQVSEDDIWTAIAGNFSLEWKKKYADLCKVNAELAEMDSDDNVSLGPIGLALDSAEREPLVNQQNVVLAEFTQLNELLKQDKDLRDIFSATIKKKKMLERSFNQTQKVREAGNMLHFMDDQPAMASAFSLRSLFSRRNKKDIKPQQAKIVPLSREI